MLMEGFKNCLPSDIKTYLDEQRIDTLHQAATHADDYALTHKLYGKTAIRTDSSSDTSTTNEKHQSQWSFSWSWKTNGRGALLPGGPMCYYCRRKGHVMSECVLFRRRMISQSQIFLCNVNIPEEYGPFISRGSVSLVDTPSEKPVTILRDTGASQSTVCYPFAPSLILA